MENQQEYRKAERTINKLDLTFIEQLTSEYTFKCPQAFEVYILDHEKILKILK